MKSRSLSGPVRVFGPYGVVSLVIGCTLSIFMIAANWERLGWSGSAELTLALIWISFVFNGLLLIPVVIGWFGLRKVRPFVVRGRWPLWSATSLLTLNLVWILWNRLAMTHQWVSVRPFITVGGAIQIVMLFAIYLLLTTAPLLAIVGLRRRAITAALCAVVLMVAALAWNRHDEQRVRTPALETLVSASSSGEAFPDSGPPARPSGPVVLLALDGLSWNVVAPLLEAGRMPRLAELIRGGSIGYLDNGDESLSPIVWTSIFSGRSPAAHGVKGYLKVDLPRSGRSALDLLLMGPTIDTVYGLRHLVARIPSAGLWSLSHAGSADRRVPAIWEIATLFDRRVVVVDPLVNLPVLPVNGAMVDFKETRDPSVADAYPPELAARWTLPPIPGELGATEQSYAALQDRLTETTAFTFELAREFDPDLLVFYTRFPDTISHMNWDFHARDRFVLTDLPISRSDREWVTLVTDHLDDRLFRSYERTDRLVGDFVDRFPEATFVIVSDHGWTFSGYEHFGAPDGVLIVSGPETVRGAVLTGASVVDVTPTILARMGLPVSREIEGKVLEGIWSRRMQVVGIDAYPAIDRSIPGGKPVQLSDEEREQLRTLGYID